MDVLELFTMVVSLIRETVIKSSRRMKSFKNVPLLYSLAPADNPFCARILRPSPLEASPASSMSASPMMRIRSRKATFGSDHEIVPAVVLEDPPHRLHVLEGEPPVAAGVQVSEEQVLLLPRLDGRDRPRYFSLYESFAAAL